MTTQTIEESTMFYKLEPRPKNGKCPRCDSTDTFLSFYSYSRYCNNCDKTYTASDESRLSDSLPFRITETIRIR